MNFLKRNILWKSWIIGSLLFLVTSSFGQSDTLRYFNRIDSTANLNYWEVHILVKNTDEKLLLEQEVYSYLTKIDLLEQDLQLVHYQDSLIEAKDLIIKNRGEQIRGLTELYQGCLEVEMKSFNVTQELREDLIKEKRRNILWKNSAIIATIVAIVQMILLY